MARPAIVVSQAGAVAEEFKPQFQPVPGNILKAKEKGFRIETIHVADLSARVPPVCERLSSDLNAFCSQSDQEFA